MEERERRDALPRSGTEAERWARLADRDASITTTASARACRVPLISRTGYTGEDGFELYVAPARGRALWPP